MHTLTLVVGDWSGDGHREKDVIMISSTLDNNAFVQALEAGLEIVFGDKNYKLCSEYEESSLTLAEQDKLRKFFPEKFVELELDDSLYYISYAKLILEIVKLGNDKFVYQILENQQINILPWLLSVSLLTLINNSLEIPI